MNFLDAFVVSFRDNYGQPLVLDDAILEVSFL
jgi:hypothetical protein